MGVPTGVFAAPAWHRDALPELAGAGSGSREGERKGWCGPLTPLGHQGASLGFHGAKEHGDTSMEVLPRSSDPLERVSSAGCCTGNTKELHGGLSCSSPQGAWLRWDKPEPDGVQEPTEAVGCVCARKGKHSNEQTPAARGLIHPCAITPSSAAL